MSTCAPKSFGDLERYIAQQTNVVTFNTCTRTYAPEEPDLKSTKDKPLQGSCTEYSAVQVTQRAALIQVEPQGTCTCACSCSLLICSSLVPAFDADVGSSSSGGRLILILLLQSSNLGHEALLLNSVGLFKCLLCSHMLLLLCLQSCLLLMMQSICLHALLLAQG